MIGRLSFTLALMAGSAGLAFAGADRAGTTAANFLAVGSGAGILGMGGASLGLGGDLSTVSWNAGSLGWLEETQLALSHAPLPDQTSQDWAAVGGRSRLLDLRWALSGLYHSEGSIEGRDALNNPTGNISASSLAAALHLARPIGSAVTAGLGVKFVNEKLADVNGSGVAVDAGLQARAGMFGFGIAAQNLGGRMSYSGSSYPMPASFGLGAGFEHAPTGVRVALDANFPAAYYSDVRGGAEWRWKDMIALRAGYRAELGAPAGEMLGGPSFGMRAGTGGVWMDYGYVVAGGTGEHRLGITMHPGSLGRGSESAESQVRTPKVKAPKPAKVEKPKAEEAAAVEKPATTEEAPKPAPAPDAKTTQAPSHESASAPAPPAAPATMAPAPTAASAPTPTTAPKTAPAPAAAALAPTTAPKSTPAPAPTTAAAPKATTAPAPTPTASAAPKPAAAAAPAKTTAAKAVTAPAKTTAPKAAAPTTPAAKAAPAPAATASTAAKEAVTPAPSASTAPKEAPSTAPAATTTQAPVKAEETKKTPQQAPVKADESKKASEQAQAKVEEPKKSSAEAPAQVDDSKKSPEPTAAPRPKFVTVRSGETLGSIAKRFGTSAAAFMMENNLVTENVKPGQRLKVPAQP